MLDPIVRGDPPCVGPSRRRARSRCRAAIPETKTTTWVEPRVRVRGAVSRVDARRRAAPRGVPAHARRQGPARLRAAGLARAVAQMRGPRSRTRLGAPRADAPSPSDPPADAASRRSRRRRSAFSNLKKIYWPAERYTKGDLIEYYRAICAVDAAVSARIGRSCMTRFPDGIDGKSFYQKDAPEFAPEWIRTFPIWSKDTQRDIRYFVCDDVDSLALRRQPRLDSDAHLDQPRRIAGAARLVRDRPRSQGGAVLRRRCARRAGAAPALRGDRAAELREDHGQDRAAHPAAARPAVTYAQSRTLGELLARVVLRELGDIATITRT